MNRSTHHFVFLIRLPEERKYRIQYFTEHGKGENDTIYSPNFAQLRADDNVAVRFCRWSRWLYY